MEVRRRSIPINLGLATVVAAVSLALHPVGTDAQTAESSQANAQSAPQPTTPQGGQVETVTSRDGTTIAFDRMGAGPPVVLVSGGSTDRMANAPLAALLSQQLTVFNYDRRGRGPSVDTPPYAVQREIEDLEAVLAAAGGSAAVYGTSSGAALALEAAATGLPITKLALWEPPYFVDDTYPRPPADTARTYTELVQAGRRGDAVEYFMRQVVGLPPEFVAQARQAPFWQAQEDLAHTLAYDATIMGDYSVPTERVATVRTPTLVLTGGSSFPFMHSAARAIADLIPGGQMQTLPGQEHNVDPSVLAPALTAFFTR
jgi:pimeloyl-ACP methyl ester carboxylesterase